MALSLIVPIFGPPAAGKTTLTLRLGSAPGRRIFRLREHVPTDVLAATATSSERLGWIDEFTVGEALRSYFDAAHADPDVHTVLLDNFPGSASQVDQLLTTLWALTPPGHIEAIEVVTDAKLISESEPEFRPLVEAAVRSFERPRTAALELPAADVRTFLAWVRQRVEETAESRF